MRLSAGVVDFLNQGIASLLAAASDEDDGTLLRKEPRGSASQPP
jgi:hypothetical protein